MFFFAFAVVLFMIVVVTFILYKKKIVSKDIGVVVTTTNLVVGSLLLICGHGLRLEARKTYEELIEQKSYIERNIDSDDVFTQLKVEDEYFKYMFKYSQVLDSASMGIFSGYWGLDIDSLEIEWFCE